MLSNPILRNSIIIVLVNGCFLLVYHCINKNKKIDVYYKSTCRVRYALLQITYSILFVSFILNARMLTRECLGFLFRARHR